ncbi:MAG: c-type cytochrome [Sphingobacteriales bacterium]|nr:MAG: c-type cytochrome [Sphingobacteriales bacterium]
MKMKVLLSFMTLAITLLVYSCGTQEATQTNTETAGNPEPEMGKGQKLFINNCIQCHNIKKDKIGPKLEGIIARWDNDTARIHAFIRNSQEVIKSGDPRAVKLYDDWNKTVMTPMPHLSDGDIDAILEYINKGVE